MKKTQTQQVLDKIKEVFTPPQNNPARRMSCSSLGLYALLPSFASHVKRRGVGEAQKQGLIHWDTDARLYIGGKRGGVASGNKLEVQFEDGTFNQHDTLDQVEGDVIDHHNAQVFPESITEVTPKGVVVKHFSCSWNVTIEEV